MNSLRHWLRLVRTGGGIDSKRLLRAANVSVLSALCVPLRLAERACFGRRIERTEISEPPVFILGHWRTGTTHLHYMMSHDPNLTYVPTFQTLAPTSYLVGRRTLRPVLARVVPDKRHMDNMDLSVDHPQEEEFALCNFTPHTFYLGWYFPKRMPELFRKYVLFEGVSEGVLNEWREAYLLVLKKATLNGGGRRLVLKNPVNTARIRLLLDLFPNAKFIHIHRDPYVVFKSTQRFHRTTLDLVSFQQISDAEIERNTLMFYRDLMMRFLEDRSLIPKGNLVEVRYDDIEEDPLRELGRIYESINLPGWDQARSAIEPYLAKQNGYEKNRFTMAEADVAKVEQFWQFAIDEWGYERPPVNAS
jgi:hypothetical protein